MRAKLGRLPHPHDDILQAARDSAHALHDYAAIECQPEQEVNATIHSLLAAAVETAATLLEDRALHEELAGYAEYARHVRYRLLPGVW